MMRFVIPFAIILGFIAVVTLPYAVADFAFGLSHPWPTFIGIGSLILVITLVFSGLIWIQRNQRMVLRTSHHPVFGDVRHLQNHWEANVDLSPYGSAVEVWGEAKDPSAEETETFICLRQRLSDLLALIPEQLQPFLTAPPPPIAIEDLCLDFISLSSTAMGSFKLMLSLPKHERAIPLGVTVVFVGFQIDDISDNH